jgi:hypothetical protein
VNPSFSIASPDIDTTDSNLLIEVSNQGISFIIINAEKHCTALSMYHFVAGTAFDEVANYLDDIATTQPTLQAVFKKVSFVYAFSTSLLVPQQFMMNSTPSKNMLDMVYGDTTEVIVRSDFVPEYNLHNIYRVPKQVDWVIANLFSHATHYHLYSLLPQAIKPEGNYLYCIFSTTQIAVQLVKEGRLQVVQNFEYRVPADAVYHLLNVCERFDADVNETLVQLNGMVDVSSNLFDQLYKYFPHLRFGSLTDAFTYEEEIKQFPAHYFSHLFQLATCV